MHTPDSHLIQKYFLNQCSKPEAKIVLDWFKTEEGKLYLESHLLSDLESASDNQHFIHKPKLTANDLLTKIHNRPQNASKAKKNRHFFYSIAAVITLVMFFSGWLVFKEITEDKWVMAKANYGENKTLLLPDSSMVILNANSTLKYAKDWPTQEARVVQLDGEAYFSVRHTNTDQEFKVLTSNGFYVNVLGTEFNVTSRAQTSRVVLESGKVQLQIRDNGKVNELDMIPGELIEFTRENNVVVKKQVNTHLYTSWKNSEMIFDNTSLSEISQLIKDNYGLTVVVSDPQLLNEHFSGTIPSNDLETLLQGLESLLPVSIRQEQNHIKISSQSQ
ncbi:FecR domain-containing protein [Rapidithrix thailandica]|uniref:FecR domain-containing protein n=1 Tax=Rapidithrix thailandica TaxID=413964 RepID=A0AAW9SE52_9BACT